LLLTNYTMLTSPVNKKIMQKNTPLKCKQALRLSHASLEM